MGSLRGFLRRSVLGLALVVVGACASQASDTSDETTAKVEGKWDSAAGNPTHPTHSIMAEFAIGRLQDTIPEVAQYKKSLVTGANLELHDLVLKDPTYEALRLEIGGNNWAADHPELLWTKAKAAYAAHDKTQAYFYIGVLLHYVQDMGVPAHAFHVIHQSSPGNWDNTELLAFFDFHGDLHAEGPVDPELDSPLAYIDWSAAAARDQFNSIFPGQTYSRTFLPQGYADLTEDDWTFLRGREAHCAHATTFALRSAALALAASVR